MMTQLPSKNPAVTKLFAGVNPLAAQALAAALRIREPLEAEHLSDDLLAPAFILANVARDFRTVLIDDYALLRQRLERQQEACPPIVEQLLAGCTFNSTPPMYPEAARMNCAPGEVRIEYLPLGTQLYLNCGEGRTRRGTLVSKTASRAVVEWQGQASSRTFHDNRNDKDVIITASGTYRQGCCLECGVTPIHRVISPEDHDWAVNAFKELTMTFDEPKRGKK